MSFFSKQWSEETGHVTWTHPHAAAGSGPVLRARLIVDDHHQEADRLRPPVPPRMLRAPLDDEIARLRRHFLDVDEEVDLTGTVRRWRASARRLSCQVGPLTGAQAP